jgi:3-deoxy-D-manno-octulosonic acid (KDO) 8-phosphate synthase
MKPEKELLHIEFTLKKIFEKNNISRYDVNLANKLFRKWQILSKYKENNEYPILNDILDKQPICNN